MNKPVPVNPPELRSTFVAAAAMPWQRTEFAGIEMKIAPSTPTLSIAATISSPVT